MPFSMEGKSANSASDQSMHFWGICCESGKQYAQVVGQRFRITMAVLDPKSSSKSGDKTVSLIVIRGGVEYLLCVLKHEEIHQVNLNLIFDKGENVIFYINGYGKVYLSGYQLTDSEKDVLNDENGYLCPLVEVKFSETKSGRKGKIPKTPGNTSELATPRSKKKLEAEKNDFAVSDKKKKGDGSRYRSEASKLEDLEFDDESESDDEDFQIEDLDSEEESESEDEESYESEEEEEEEDDSDELEEIVFTEKSQKKRKLENVSQPPKRSRVDSGNTSSADEKSVNAVVLADNDSKDSSDSDVMNSSIGNTPMPKKQNSAEKKKAKKKKRLSEISILSEKSAKGKVKPVNESTPNQTGNKAVKKLEGGILVQDVVIGRGPEAKTGKMVHVFYVGRLQNNHQIFDSRVPGKKPFSFKLGAQQVIKGWDIGLQGMKVGGKRKIIIPPNMGYGNSKLDGIPPNSTLNFIVELQAVS